MHQHNVEDNTHIKDVNRYLSSTKTKDLLTVYLAEKVVQNCKAVVTAVTRMGLLSIQVESEVAGLESSQVEAIVCC